MKRALLVMVGVLGACGLAMSSARAGAADEQQPTTEAPICAAGEEVAAEAGAMEAVAVEPIAAPAPAAQKTAAPKSAAPAPGKGATRAAPKAEAAKPAAAAPPELRNKISVDYEYEAYNSVFTPWHFASLEYAHKYDRWTLVGRGNYAHRFGEDATQYEVDAYPKLWKGAYAYFNYGYSPDIILPRRRFGGELFWTLPRHFEASLGLRRLDFETSNVTIWTGSIGYYVGNFWFSLRPFVSHKPGKTSRSYVGTMRWYFGDKEDYLTVWAGTGPNNDLGETEQTSERLNSRTFRVEAQKMIRPRLILKAKIGYRDQDFPSNQTRESWIVGAGIAKLF